MHDFYKPLLKNLLIFTLFLLPITQVASNEPTQDVNQLQTQMMKANEKIAALASDHQKITGTISILQTSLNTANREIRDLKIDHNQLVGTNAGNQRTANGHGR